MSDLPPPPPNMQPPPGYVAYGGSGGSGMPTRPIRALGMWLVVLIAAAMVGQLVAVPLQFTLRDAARDFLSTNDASAFDDKIALFLLLTVLISIASIGQIVVLCVWTFRLAKNAQALGRSPQSFSPGATVAVNLLGGCTLGILPFFMWRELWVASDPDTPPGDITWKRRAVTALIPVHLALTLAGVVVGVVIGLNRGLSNGISFGNDRDDLAETLDDKLALIGLQGAIGVAASIVFLLIVRQLTARHARAIGEG